MNSRSKEVLELPVSLKLSSDGIVHPEELFGPIEEQTLIGDTRVTTIPPKGFLVLDFGKEAFGSVRLQIISIDDSLPLNFRLRTGESLSEASSNVGEKGATNDHSTRDALLYASPNSDMTWFQTGFRFVRIDNLSSSKPLKLHRVYRLSIGKAEMPSFSFESSDARLNQIIATATHTIASCLQHGVIWDGIKRDQHVWAGDLFPEVLGALTLYPDPEEVPASFALLLDHQDDASWINGLPLYNDWLAYAILRYLERVPSSDSRYLSYLEKQLDSLSPLIDESGRIDFTRSNKPCDFPYFFDWPNHDNAAYSRLACEALLVTLLDEMASSYVLPSSLKEKAKSLSLRLSAYRGQLTSRKAINAMEVLAHKIDVKEGVDSILKGSAEGYSVFLTYFIGKALAEHGKTEEALHDLCQYYGAMIDLGATTFFEDFDLSWAKNACRIDELPTQTQNDFHGDHGAYCYQGFRHSLCHGWSVGILPWTAETLLGIRFLTPDTIRFDPKPTSLQEIYGIIPSTLGDIQVSIKKGEPNLIVPKGMKVISIKRR
ncbi:MAG: hypothetical protein PUC66_05130 [Erysipelotrichaceae bacterium]|nr:hypothetical protein [Erysipelotrichaceae bacterium]MDD6801288.1 hypothetical protein [Mollicutes bacterium]